MNVVLHRMSGSKPSPLIRKRIRLVIEEVQVATPQRTRQHYHQRYGERLGWHTANRHLRALVETGELTEQVMSAGHLRNTVIYRLKR